tara:strand:- start:37 stop:756 length:720 start_codon:yes stop_codon:yes gene_type:complete
MKKNLLVICCGKRAYHQSWKEFHKDYNFDLALIVFDETYFTDHNSQNAKYVFMNRGRKYENIATCISKDIYRKYEHIGIIDHDVDAEPPLIHNLFEFGIKHNFDLYQPAYNREGHPSHVDFLAVEPEYDYRVFNTVEIMCPFFSQRAYNVVCNEFDTSPFMQGYGLEYAWEGILGSYEGKTIFGGNVGVIDKYPITHLDPIVQRFETSEPDIWYYRTKYLYKRMAPFNRDVIKGVKVEE